MSNSDATRILAWYDESRVRRRRREEILVRAGTLFSNTEHETLTMRDIAKALELERRTLYGYYNNKLDLLVDAHLHMSERLIAQNPFVVGDDSPTQLEATLIGYTRYLFGVLREWRFVMEYETFLRHAEPGSTTLSRFLDIRSQIASERNTFRDMIAAGAGMSLFDLSGDSPEETALVIEQSLRAYVMRVHSRLGVAPHYSERNVERLVSLLVAGLKRGSG